jgi:hypothetical protein
MRFANIAGIIYYLLKKIAAQLWRRFKFKKRRRAK